MQEKVLITGMGVISPIGTGKDEFYNGLDEGKTGVKPITRFKTEIDPSMFGGEITDLKAPDYLGSKGLRYLTRGTQMLLISSHLALMDSQVRVRKKAFPHYQFIMPAHLSFQFISITPDRYSGVIVGSTLGVFDAISNFHKESIISGWRGVSPMEFPNTVFNSPAGYLAIREKSEGPNLTVSTGHASSTDAFGMALNYLQTDYVKTIFCGSMQELGPCLYLLFRKAGFLCKSIDDFNPAAGKRSGTLLGEGSASFILEKKEAAEKTGAGVLAEIQGYGTAFDAVSPQYKYDMEARAAIQSIKMALDHAGLSPKDIDFVSSGLAGNAEGDAMELRAIQEVFGQGVPILAVKTLVGETFDASGAFQVAAALYAFEKNSFIKNATLNPPTAKNFRNKRALITSFGFNGHNSALVVENKL